MDTFCCYLTCADTANFYGCPHGMVLEMRWMSTFSGRKV